MKYKIKVEKEKQPKPGDSYNSWEDVYEQTRDIPDNEINLMPIIEAFNGHPNPRT